MFHKFNLITGILALGLFSYAQYQGWSLLTDVADSGGRSSGGRSSYHK